MKGILQLCVAVVLFLLPACAKGAPILTVYFIPFEASTFVPVTRDDISCRALEKWAITDAAQAAKLMNIVTHGEQGTYTFDYPLVRVLVSDKDKTYYIDHKGVTVVGKLTYKIDPQKIEAFRQSLNPNDVLPRKRSKCS